VARRLRVVSGSLGALELLSGGGRLDAEELMDAALRGTGFSRTALDDVAEPLGRLLGAMDEEADLSALGHWTMRWDVHQLLSNLLRLQTEEERKPTILDEAVEAPVFITGLPRSGTTFLHRLMAEDPASLAPRHWQTVYPYPDAGRRPDAADTRARRAEAQLRWFSRLSPDIRSVHPIDSQFPQECIQITAHVFQSPRFSDMYDIPSYRQSLDDHGYFHAYRFHKRFLQHLQSQAGQSQAGYGRWVLKAPEHVFALDALQGVYPDARFVFVHRDPERVIPSVARLTEILRTPFAHRVDPVHIGRQVTDDWARAAAIMVDLDRRKLIDPGRVVHVLYSDLVTRPLDTVERIYGHFGLTLAPAAAQAMRRLVADNPRGGYGRNHYSLGTYGIDPREIRDRFGDYVLHFGIPTDARPAEVAAA
jgi:hypothetical protein